MTPTTPTNPNPEPRPAHDTALDLNLYAASRLIQAAATTGQTVIDLDDDPTLQQAATSRGCHYLGGSITSEGVPEPGTDRGDLVVVRWPSPDGHLTWMTRAPETMRAIRRLLAPSGLVAVVLEPTPVEQFTITWTGVLLSAAATAGLTVLQDVICLHDRPGPEELPAATGHAGPGQHRVVLVLRAPAGRHTAEATPAFTGRATARADRVHEGRGWTVERVRGLGMTTDLETAAEILGIGRTLAYDLIKNDQFPVRLLRLGRRVLVPVPELLQFLGQNASDGG
jgi:predicted DNA-binding transcriptional regulator AlpA